MKKEVSEPIADQLITSIPTMNLINSSAISSKDGIVQACSLQILSLLVRHLMTVKRTVDPIPLLKIDVTKVMDLFERQIT
jgi:hypothetical protein